MTAATFTVPTIVIILPLLALVFAGTWFLTRWATTPLRLLVERWERREVAKLTPDEQAQYWAEKEARQ